MLKRINLPLIATAACVFVLVLGMGACSSSGSDSAASTSGPTTSSTSTDAASACGVHKVGTVEVRTFCGTGTASVKSTKVTFSLPTATCETSADYISVNAGTVVLGLDDAAKKVKATTQYIGLTVGKIPGDSSGKPASSDGAYGSGILAVNDKGTALLTNPKTLKITLTGNRTAGSYTGDLLSGGMVSGTFTCN